MVFSSLLFAFFFLPAVIILYFLAKEKYRNYILLFASMLFYAYGEPEFVFVMIGSIIMNYLMALLIAKKKAVGSNLFIKIALVVDIVLNIGILFVFKYLDFLISITNSILSSNIPLCNIVLPIGISFFTFQALSYVIDVFSVCWLSLF